MVHYRVAVVTYDQRGTGRSTRPSGGVASYALPRYVADLEAVREALVAEQVHLLGHSWGGLVAMSYATRYPERVRSLVLMGDFLRGQRALDERVIQLQGECPDSFFAQVRAFLRMP